MRLKGTRRRTDFRAGVGPEPRRDRRTASRTLAQRRSSPRARSGGGFGARPRSFLRGRRRSSGEDRAARLWDVATGEPLCPLWVHGFVSGRGVFVDANEALVFWGWHGVTWKFAPETAPVDELVRLAQVLTGTSASGVENYHGISSRVSDGWEELRPRYGRWFE